jgi:hypothetical protein
MVFWYQQSAAAVVELAAVAVLEVRVGAQALQVAPEMLAVPGV